MIFPPLVNLLIHKVRRGCPGCDSNPIQALPCMHNLMVAEVQTADRIINFQSSLAECHQGSRRYSCADLLLYAASIIGVFHFQWRTEILICNEHCADLHKAACLCQFAEVVIVQKS